MVINDIFIIMLRALLCTIIIELIVGIILKIRNKKDLINIILVNCLTNPLVVTIPLYVNIKYGLFERHICLLLLEIFALAIEGFIYKKYLEFNKINPYVLSIILNACSYSMGEVINFIIY